MAVTGLVLAAGRGERFALADPGAPPKMLAPIDGVPMVRRTVDSLLAGGINECLVVVSEQGAESIRQALQGLPVRVIVNPDPSRGMFSSVQCGLAVADAAFCVLLPGDMPYVQSSTVAALVAVAQVEARSAAPTIGGHRGHPVVLTRACCARIAAAPADARLDHVLAGEDLVSVDVSDRGVRRDVDRPPVPMRR
jgi:molybdenum cofactor cytidylyltransferase